MVIRVLFTILEMKVLAVVLLVVLVALVAAEDITQAKIRLVDRTKGTLQNFLFRGDEVPLTSLCSISIALIMNS